MQDLGTQECAEFYVLCPLQLEAPPWSQASVSEPPAPGHQLVIGEGII